MIELRDVTSDDLNTFFEQQQDESANFMAGYGPKNPSDRGVFDLYWQELLSNELAYVQTITLDSAVIGAIIAVQDGDEQSQINYWIAKRHWGKGLTSEALKLFLDQYSARPLQAHIVADNKGALSVLEKHGFTQVGEAKNFSNVRGEVVNELVLELS